MKIDDLLNKSSLIIGTSKWAIKYQDKVLDDKKEELYGTVSSKTETISIYKRSDIGMLTTLLHEVIHVLDYDFNLFDVKDSEPVVESLAVCLMHFLIDNKIIEVPDNE